MGAKLTQAGVARELNVTPRTVRLWYEYVEEFGPHPSMPKLPPYETIETGKNRTYLWDADDLPLLIAYRDAMPKTRGGFMAEITNKYRKSSTDQED